MTFVLVPAAWCGGWVWKRVTPILEAAGHAVHAVTFTGLGDRVHLANAVIDTETHILDVVNVLEFEDLLNVTLVGWSYGGFVTAAVADRVPERVRRVIFLDSSVPLDGQSLYDSIPGGDEAQALFESRASQAGTPGWLPFDPAGVESQVPDEQDRQWYLSKIVPHPLATFAQPVRLREASLPRVAKVYIQCTDGRDPLEPDPPFILRAKSEPGWHYRALAANHFAPVSAYQELAREILQCVAQQ